MPSQRILQSQGAKKLFETTLARVPVLALCKNTNVQRLYRHKIKHHLTSHGRNTPVDVNDRNSDLEMFLISLFVSAFVLTTPAEADACSAA